ncbi:carboxypeptidase-like regulatory domain-containing protein [Ekhidna sp. To15]|uniref:carboxypeptidase-like regulatory domain-containing protein n=1 Tax=Ekhidna sp. To15 TaxID=3395267 RepID=UPI003F51F582
MKTLFFCLLLFSCDFGFSQDQIIKGKVVDAKTKLPIPYAAIGIVGENVGTVSDENGLFRVVIPSKFMDDSLTFSEVVHVRKKLSIAHLLNSKAIVIVLEEAIRELRTVEITPKKEKRSYEKLGVKPLFYWGSCYANFEGGAQIAQLMEASAYPIYLSKARIKIGDNTLEKAKLRVRVLEKTADGLPGLDVFEGVFMDIAYQEGWIEVDLNEQNLVMTENFFITFEFLNLSWQPTSGYFSIVCSEVDTFSKKQLVRNASLGKWQNALPGQRHIYAIGAEVFRLK